MDNSNLNQPNQYPAGPYPPDKTWGIVIIVFSVLGIACGGCAVVGGGVVGALGGAAAAGTTAAGHPDAAAVAAGGGMLMVMGIIIAVLSAVRLYGGMLIMKSKKLGFIISGACSGASILFALYGFSAQSVVGIAISAVVIYYCVMRVTGKMGPPVLD